MPLFRNLEHYNGKRYKSGRLNSSDQILHSLNSVLVQPSRSNVTRKIIVPPVLFDGQWGHPIHPS
jgi:hypothetical protein